MSTVHSRCDEGIADARRPCLATPNPKAVLATTILASGLALIDGSVVNVGLSAVGASYGGVAAGLQWIINAYLLPLSALLLLGGAAGDRYGHGRLLICGVTMFATASVTCALAPTLNWLLVSRGVQGFGAALLLPNSLAILGEHFAGEGRARAIGIWASAGAVLAAFGPVLGGWLIDISGWRSIFLINLPPAALTIALAFLYIHDPPVGRVTVPLDLPGGILATTSLGALTWGLTEGCGHSGWTPTVFLITAAGVILLAIFALVEGAKEEAAMMPPSLFGSKSFLGITLLTLLLYAALATLLVLMPYVLIRAGGYSAAQSGAALLPFAAILALTSPLMGMLAGKIGPRIPLIVGPLVVAAG